MITRDVFDSGRTGNATSAGAEIDTPPGGAPVALLFVVEAVGATPTVTYKWQGSLDNSTWEDVPYILSSSATEAVAARVRTTTGPDTLFLALPTARFYRYYRCVVSANTNVTYRALLATPD